jgi:hypothetical protein
MRFLPIPAWHRQYVRSHPGWPWINGGVAASGWSALFVALFVPEFVSASAVAQVLPTWLYILFSISWAAGGTAATTGLLHGCSRLEGLGLMLMAGGFSAYYIAVLAIRPTAAVLSVFIAFLVFGCVSRAWHLFMSGGYEGEQR